MTLSALVLGVALLAPQDPEDRRALARFAALDAIDKATLIRDLDRRLRLDPDPSVQRVLALGKPATGWPLAVDPGCHDAARWAKGVAPARQIVRSGTAAHDDVRERIPPQTLLPDLQQAVFYDWGAGRIVRRARPLSYDEIFANYLHGYVPGSDVALARVLAALDDDAAQRPVAGYLAHWYADLQARAYEGVTLYEAWYSEAVVDVPDVDAIPFAVGVLGSNAFRSPIPPGAERTALYARIRDAAFALRKYRTLREAIAATFLCAEPDVDAPYRNLLPRAHTLWATVGNDPAAAAARLREIGDRDRFVTVMGSGGDDATIDALRDTRLRDLQGLRAKLRALAIWALTR